MYRRNFLAFVGALLLALSVLMPAAAYADEAVVSLDAQDQAVLQADADTLTTDETADTEVDVAAASTAGDEESVLASDESVTEEAVAEEQQEETADSSEEEAEDSDEGEASEVSAVEQSNADDELQVTPANDEQELTVTSDEQAQLDAFAAAHAYDIASGIYAVQSGLGNNLVMDVDHAGTTNGTNIIVWESLNAKNQRWELTSAGGGYFTIASVSSGKYLDISGSDSGAALLANIVQWSKRSSTSKSQLWVISNEGDGYKFTSAVLGANGERLVLDVYGGAANLGAKVILWADKNASAANQRWSFYVTDAILDDLASEHKGDIADGTYFISSELGKNLVLDVEWASLDNAANAVVWPKNPSANEGWTVTHDSQGYLTITNALSGKVLDVYGGTASIGSTVIQWMDKKDGARNQKWIASLESDGTYRLVSALPFNYYLALDVYGAEAKAQAKTILWVDKGDGAKNQRWSFETAPEQYAYAHSVANGTYTIRTALDGTKALDVYNAGKTAGTKVILWVTKASSAANQKWVLSHDSQGYVHLTNQNSNMELAFSSAGTAVQQDEAFCWVVEQQSDGSYALRAATGSHAGKYLDVAYANPENGATVLAWVSNGGKNQNWYIGTGGKVIALDPGHGGDDSGAAANGLREADLNWNITVACAERLRSFGYEVYITMTEAEFKSSSTDSPTIYQRVQRAYNNGATAIFSMHINAGGGNGAVVLVPNNSSYHYEFYTQGQQFASILLPKINAIGIGTWNDGAWERNYSTADGAETNLYYEGGGFQDYYGIVRYARLKGMFGVIIEHGFIDSSDVNKLGQSVVQTKLGQADADAIMALYG